MPIKRALKNIYSVKLLKISILRKFRLNFVHLRQFVKQTLVFKTVFVLVSFFGPHLLHMYARVYAVKLDVDPYARIPAFDKNVTAGLQQCNNAYILM